MLDRLRKIRATVGWISTPPGQLLVVAAVTLFILALGAVNAFGRGEYYEVHLNGQFLGVIEDAEVAENLYQYYVSRAQQDSELEVFPRESLRINHIRATDDIELTAPSLIATRMQNKLTFVTRATAIIVDGEEIVALPTLEAAEMVLEEIKTAYVSTLESRGKTEVMSARFNQDITVEPRFYDPDAVGTVEHARDLLMRGTDEIRVHVVQRGDSLWAIASSNNMTVADLQQANPQISNPNLVQPGERVNLVVARPFITLSSEEQVIVSTSIPFRTRVVYDDNLWSWQRVVRQQGVPGRKELTYLVVREGGREVGRELVREEITSQPREQIIAQGTRQVPDRGTGTYVWPVVGQITSGYGARWGGFHHGVDIAAPLGTTVLAADSGTVVAASWLGNYGLTIMIDHGGGRIVTLYAHLSRTAVSLGTVVSRGQVIGYVGNTGLSTGPHLHFEMRVNGRPVDPVAFYASHN